MSLKNAIRDKIPFEWELALKKKKKLGLFIDLTYCSLPQYVKSKYGFKDGVKRIEYMFKHYSNPSDCFNLPWINVNIKEIPISDYREIFDEIDKLVQTIKFNQA